MATRSGAIVLFALALCTGQPFPILPPTPDADPTIRHEVKVEMPATLIVQRTADKLSVSYDQATLQIVSIMVGKKMFIGMKDEFRVYPDGDARPEEFRGLTMGSVLESDTAAPFSNPNFLKSSETLTAAHDHIPARGKHYIVEHDITLFETDIPAQHFWNPRGSPKYKVLWKRACRPRAKGPLDTART
jgi:hypothetical protein